MTEKRPDVSVNGQSSDLFAAAKGAYSAVHTGKCKDIFDFNTQKRLLDYTSNSLCYPSNTDIFTCNCCEIWYICGSGF